MSDEIAGHQSWQTLSWSAFCAPDHDHDHAGKLGLLVPVTEILNATTYKQILYNCLFPTLYIYSHSTYRRYEPECMASITAV